MQKSKVFFTDFRTKAHGDGLPTKLRKLILKAGLKDIDMDGKFVAIKMHFGELGNISYLRPNYARAVVDVVKELGGKPFLTDCNTLYPGSRKNALEHLYCAWENGFTPLTVGCPILIGDGLKGTDDIEVPVIGGEYVEKAKIQVAESNLHMVEQAARLYLTDWAINGETAVPSEITVGELVTKGYLSDVDDSLKDTPITYEKTTDGRYIINVGTDEESGTDNSGSEGNEVT